MISLGVAVMGHPMRQHFIDALLRQLPDAAVVLDQRGDRWDTGRRSLLAFDPAATHHLVIQDDAIPCRDLVTVTERAVKAAGEHPVSLYTGKVRPHELTVTAAVIEARRRRTPWIAGRGPYWGVGLVIPTAHIPELVEFCDRLQAVRNYDRRIEAFYTRKRIDCWYTVPSLVDHRPVAENPSLVAGRTANRRAHTFLGRRSGTGIDWKREPVRIGEWQNPASRQLLRA